MGYDQRRGHVVEWLGPAGLLMVAWRVRFQPPQTMEIATVGVAMRLGSWCVWLPRWLGVHVRAIEHADLTRDDAITIDLIVTHPLVGALFGYTGSFRIRRESVDENDPPGSHCRS